MGLVNRLQHAWNAFSNKDPTKYSYEIGGGYSYRQDKIHLTRGSERSIINSIRNRIALDASSITITHARLDKDRRYSDDIDSDLNSCLNLSANIDQTGRAFLQDAYQSMLEDGTVALVPVDTDWDPVDFNSYRIFSMRTGRIIEWYPKHIKASVYNEITGNREDIILPKSAVSIVENPFYSVMNEPNSILQRIIRKLSILDVIDEQTGSGKMNIIIQLPYIAKTPMKQQQAEERRSSLESQLANSKYGVGYVDGSEKIIQLNRSVENNIMSQIEYLMNMLYGQLGITQGILDGTADEQTMINFRNRTIEPIVASVADEMKRKFLTKTARSQGQSIMYFSNPFKLTSVSNIAEIADKFTRNEIMTSNEFRQVVGMKPSKDPRADELRNKNLSEPKENQNRVVEVNKEENENEV